MVSHSPNSAARPAPTGHVRKTAGHYRGGAAADRFAGFTDGHPKQLLEPLRRLGRALPFPRGALDTLSLLFDFSRLADWEEGRPPMVFPSNAELAGSLGVNERTVRNHLSALEAAGAIAIRRGPGNRRTPVRDHAGRVVDSYGINLAPMVELAAGLAEAAKALKARRQELARTMRRLGAALAEVRVAADAVEVALADGLGDAEALGDAALRLATLKADAESKSRTARRAYEADSCLDRERHAANAALITSLAGDLVELAAEANELASSTLLTLQSADFVENKESGGAENKARKSLQAYPFDPTDRYDSCKTQVAAGRLPLGEAPDEPAFRPSPPDRTLPVRLKHIFELHPPFAGLLRNYLLVEDPATAGADQVIQAARVLAGQLGASGWCWEQGCRAHGAGAAALAVLVAAAKPAHEIRKSRGAFLAGLLLRPPGDLNALASFHALRKKRTGAVGGDPATPRKL